MAHQRLLPHERLLVSILHRTNVGDGLPDLVRLLNDSTTRAVFRRDAAQHGVLGMALTVLDRTPEFVNALTPATAAELFAPLPIMRRQAALWDLELGRVVHRLQSSGIDPIVLKGGALRMTTYAESIERSFADLDVLVQEHEVSVAMATLEAAKYSLAYADTRALYEAHHFHYIMQHPGGYTVEVHWALTAPAAQVRLDTEAFRSRSIRLDVPYSVRVPSPEDMVLHLICQNLEDGFAKLRRTVDVDRVISDRGDFDWPYLVDAARRGCADTAAALALQLSSRLLGTPLPQLNAAAVFALPRAARAGVASVRPAIVHVRFFKRGNDLRRELLHLWASRGSKSWFWALGQRLFAHHYRFWGVVSASPTPGMANRAVRVVKLLGLQGWSFVTALAGLLTRPGRAALRFWAM